MKEVLSEHQLIAIEALKDVQRICDKYHLTLYLLAGTTLGAVRHRGMIPWDDDIDIGLTYKDWIKLKSVLPLELDKRFTYANYDTLENFPRLFPKILYQQQSCIDIFLISKWKSNKISANFYWQIRRTITEFYKFSLNYINPVRKTNSKSEIRRTSISRSVRKSLFMILKPFCSKNNLIKLAKWNEQHLESKKYDSYINLYSIYKMPKEIIKKQWIEKTSLVEFEGHQYTTVGDTDAYLTHLYGDYMVLPPKEKRISVHSEKFETVVKDT